jgi:hypothetical protein
MVVTDDQGRYVLPDLPKANYSVWVRGYGLVDSPKVQAAPGKVLNLPQCQRRMRRRLPNIIRRTDGCFHCHALGTKATRTIPEAFGTFKSGYEAWTRRLQSGQASKDMVETIERFGTERGLKILSDWTDRIAEGETPAAKPPRPQGLEAQCRDYGVGLVGPEGLSAR